ncbi:MAG: hypothetical protein CMH98_22195 [Oceanospirillaceae bacterium]|nr:hypothetical protein [Oceanospirillaceae bacterium]
MAALRQITSPPGIDQATWDTIRATALSDPNYTEYTEYTPATLLDAYQAGQGTETQKLAAFIARQRVVLVKLQDTYNSAFGQMRGRTSPAQFAQWKQAQEHQLEIQAKALADAEHRYASLNPAAPPVQAVSFAQQNIAMQQQIEAQQRAEAIAQEQAAYRASRQVALVPGQEVQQQIYGNVIYHKPVGAAISHPAFRDELLASQAAASAAQLSTEAEHVAANAAWVARQADIARGNRMAQQRSYPGSYTHTGVGAVDPTRMPDGTLAVVPPVEFSGVPPVHPTLGSKYTGPAVTAPSGVIHSSAGFTTVTPAAPRERESSAPRAGIADLAAAVDLGDQKQSETPGEVVQLTGAALAGQLGVPVPVPVPAVVLPPSGPMDYSSILTDMSQGARETFEQMVENMAQHLTDVALGVPEQSRIVEHIPDSREPSLSPDPEVPEEDVCEAILPALRALKADLSNTGKRAKVRAYMTIIGKATSSSGGRMLSMARQMKDTIPNATKIDQIYAEAFKLCALMKQVSERVGNTMQQMQRLGRPGGRSYGGKEVKDRSQDVRRQKDLTLGHTPDRPDLSIDPIRVSHPSDRNYGTLKADRSDLNFLGNYRVPVPNTITPEQLRRSGRSAAETKYQANLKSMEKFTPAALETRQAEMDKVLAETKQLTRAYGFNNPILPTTSAGLQARIDRETNVVGELLNVKRNCLTQAKEFNKIKSKAAKTAKTTTAAIKGSKKKLKGAMKTEIAAHESLIKAQAAAAKRDTKTNTKKVESAQKKLQGAASVTSALRETITQQEVLRDDARNQQSTAETQADLVSMARQSAASRIKALRSDLSILKGSAPNMDSAEQRRRGVVDSVQQTTLDREVLKRAKTYKTFENLGIELAATNNPNNAAAALEERLRQERRQRGVDAQRAQFEKERLLAAKREAPKTLSDAERQRRAARREQVRQDVSHEGLLVKESIGHKQASLRPVTVNATRVNEILRAGKSTGQFTASARNELVAAVLPQIIAETEHLELDISYTEFNTTSAKPATGPLHKVPNKLDIFTAVRLLKDAGYDPRVVSKLDDAFEEDTRPVTRKRKGTPMASKGGTARPAKPKPKPAKPRPKPRPTSPTPPGKGGPKPTRKREGEPKSGPSKKLKLQAEEVITKDRSPSPGGRKKRSKSRSRSPRRSKRSKSPKSKTKDRRVKIGGRGPFV